MAALGSKRPWSAGGIGLIGLVGLSAVSACADPPPALECIDDDDCGPGEICRELACRAGAPVRSDVGTGCSDGGCGTDGGEPAPDAAPEDGGQTAHDLGVRDAGPMSPFDRHNIVFVTSTAYRPGDLGGLEGADGICRKHAEMGTLPRPETYVALMSDTKRSARSRIAGSRGWIRVDGLPFADRLSNLTAGVIWHPPALDEFGEPPQISLVVTGSGSDLTLRGDASICQNWTSTTAGAVHPVGDSRDGAGFWLDNQVDSRSCDDPVALYCLGTGQTEPVAPPRLPRDVKLAFSTTEPIVSGGGIESFDALCQRQAEQAGLSGRTFVALTAPGPGRNVLSRFELIDGPWYRPDGVKVADDLTNLADEALFAPVNMDASGLYYFNRQIMAGAFGTASAAMHCGSWTSTLGQTRIGRSGSTTNFFRGNFIPCSEARHLLCFEVESDSGS